MISGASDPILFDSRGHRRTASLFKEVSQDTNLPPIYTMKDYRVDDLISAYEVFMESDTEYEAAIALVGCMGHWRKLQASKWFMHGSEEGAFTGLLQWREDMSLRDAGQAMKVVRQKVREGDRQAAQYLLTLSSKTAAAPKAKAPKDTARRGTQNPHTVVDIKDAAASLRD